MAGKEYFSLVEELRGKAVEYFSRTCLEILVQASRRILNYSSQDSYLYLEKNGEKLLPLGLLV